MLKLQNSKKVYLITLCLLFTFLAFIIYSFKTLEHQSGIYDGSKNRREVIGWDVMLFAKYYIFIFLNLFVWISQLGVLL